MKILHLEDNLQDAELSHAVFIGVWPDCEVRVVDNRNDFVAQLQKAPDLILSDFNMPGFSGLEALQLARVHAPHIPFIFFSGTIGEDRAIDALRSGAADYVIKDRPQRLIPAMRRALDAAQLERERKQTEEHLLRIQRLENIGMLASGIAHDFNNLLSPILMAASILRQRHPDPMDQKLTGAIESSAARGVGLVRQIMSFGQGVGGGPQELDLRHLIREVVAMAQQTFPKNIRIEHDAPRELRTIKANATQVYQVLLNLCVNARDAMPAGGVLKVRAANQTVTRGMPGDWKVAPGEYVMLEVSDTGTGIPADVVAKIWEPFFTTKGAGKGTGLGLSTVRGIVEGHHGQIVVETAPQSGTTFRVLLPAAQASEQHAA